MIPAAEQVGADGEVIGIDLAEDMLHATAVEINRRGLPAKLLRMDAESLDFPDQSFERVLCGFGIMFLPNLDQALREFGRVLKRSGRLALSTWHVGQNDELNPVLAELGQSVDPHPQFTRLRDPAEVELALTRSGLHEVDIRIERATFVFRDLEEYWQTGPGTGARARIDALSSEQAVLARRLLADRLEPHHRSDGFHVDAAAIFALALS